MAQDAELKLKVSLDLGFFRQQLVGLGQAAAGYNIPVQVKFDRRSVQNELNTLGTNIRRRNYVLEVKTNLSKEIDNAKKLADALRALESGKSTGGTVKSGGTFRQQLEKIDTATIRNIYAAAAKEGILAFNEETNKSKSALITALNKAAQDASQGFLDAFSAQNSAVHKAAGDYGDALLNGLRKKLRSQSPSREMFDIGEDAGKGFELGLLKSMELAEQSATRKMRRMLDRLARVALMASGMSAAEINRQAGQFQAGPTINAPSWASTVPPSRGGGGGGRLLPPGPTFAALGGTAFGAQKYLPTDLSAELKQILRGAAFAFVDAIRSEARKTSVLNLGPQQRMLGGTRIAGLLEAGSLGRYSTGRIGGETREQMFARRTQEAYTRSGLRSLDIMGGGEGRPPSPYSYAYRGARPLTSIVPYQSPGALVAMGGGGGGGQPPQGPTGGGGGGGFGQFGRAMGQINLPGAGTIRELGAEFSFAAKQVLLFGTAYKALAFIQAFPSQVGQAVGQLQSFRNTLNTISPSAQEAAASNKLILDLVDKYNVPLQSARDGFTKLYASMAPAGFSGNEIRDLFTGISKAAATFGMSADKVDRVNYAFAQMASKGQVMSEELKGQLGDVLPGAMAIFAEAAGFEGPDAIQKFSKALEDGAYKGKAMRVLLKNVGIEMNKEFGPGAEGAAKTFQGLMNRMANSTQMLYESFEPVAVGFLNSVVVPLTSGIKQISDGFNAFFTGTKAQTAGGFAFAKALEDLRPAFDGIRNNLSSLVPQLTQFGQIALNIAKILLQIAGNPIVGYLGKLYLVALPLNMLFNGLSGIIGRVVMAMTTLNVGLLAGTQRFTTYRIAMQAFGVSAAQVSTTLRTWAPALNAATIGLRAIAAPAILFGVSLLIERFMMLQGAINGVAQSTQSMLGNISSLANSGAVKDLKNVGKDIQNQISSFESLRPFLGSGAAGLPQQKLTKQGAAKMRELGLGSFVSTDVLGGFYVNDFINASRIVEERLRGLRKTAESVREKLPLATRIQEDISQQVTPKPTAIPEEEDDGTGTKKLSDYLSQRSQLLEKLGQIETNRINLLANTSQEEREILQAQQTFINENQVNERKYLEEQAKAKDYSAATRGAYLAELKASYLAEKKLIEQRRELAIRGPIIRMQEELINQNYDLTASLNALEQGRTELSAVEKAALELAKRASELSKQGLTITEEEIQLTLNLAKAQDILASKYKTRLRLKSLKDEIALLRAINDEERKRLQIQQENPQATEEQKNQIFDLEKIRDNLKQARELIDNFVDSTSSDYKGFLKAVISGEDAVDALEKFQEGLKDRVLTIFLDFAMKPVEDFFKDVVGGKIIEKLFPRSEAEKQPQKVQTPVEQKLDTANATLNRIEQNTRPGAGAATQALPAGLSTAVGFGAGSIDDIGSMYTGAGSTNFLANAGINMSGMDMSQGFGQTVNGFSSAFEQINANGETFANGLLQTAEKTGEAATNTQTAGLDFVEKLGGVVQGIGMLASAAMGIVAGIRQIEKGDTASVIGGIGSILMGVGGSILGFGRLFGANGGVAQGGWKPFPITPFATGGTVSGPTLGLVGEGKYNEAIVPLPDGRSIPVQMQGDSVRDRMNNSSNSGAASPVLSMNFETTTINNVEYVSREQLERAMMETRSLATRDGARQGANLAIDKLQQSPNTRRRIGI